MARLLKQRRELKKKFNTLTSPLKTGLSRLLKPLTDKIDVQITLFNKKRNGFSATSLPSRTRLSRLRRRIQNITVKNSRRAVGKLMSILSHRSNKLLFSDIDPNTMADPAQFKSAMHRQLDRVEAAIEIRQLQNLRKRLLTDYSFVLGTSSTKVVSNPPVLQLLEIGFVRSDVIPIQAAHPLPKGVPPTRVFNSAFVKIMMEHGFDPGATWTSADTMHFDFVEGFDKIQGSGGTFGPQGYQASR